MVRKHQDTLAISIIVLFLLPYLMLGIPLMGAVPPVHAQPFSIRIFTYPSVSNAQFSLDNSSIAYSDNNGTAIFDVYPGRHYLSIAPIGRVDADTMYRFDRWGDLPSAKAIQPDRKLNMTQSITIPALVQLVYRSTIRFTYNDTTGRVLPVDNSIVDSVHFVSSSGIPIDVTNFDGAWFPANRFQRIQGGWKVLPNNYTADQVYVNGVNAVQHGLQRFSPLVLGPGSTWTVNIQLYAFTVIVRDLFFGSKVNGEVYVKSTNGTLVDKTGTAGGIATFDMLPRGYYSVGVKGLLIAVPVPVILSKPGSLELRVFSLTDMALVGIAGLFLYVILSDVRRRNRLKGGSSAPKLSGWEDSNDDWSS